MGVDRFTKACAMCEVELRVKTNGVLLVEAAIYGFLSLYEADLWHCPVCGHEMVLGVAQQAVFNHWEGDILAEIRRRENRGQRVVLCWMNQGERDKFMKLGKEADDERRKVGL